MENNKGLEEADFNAWFDSKAKGSLALSDGTIRRFAKDAWDEAIIRAIDAYND